MDEEIEIWDLPEEQEVVVEQGIKNNVIDTNSLREYILNEVGIKDKFVTGSTDNPIEISVGDLTDKQILSIYKHAIDRNIPKLDEREQQVIDMIRKGTFEDYIAETLATPQQEPEYTDADYFFWKMSEDFPELTEEQIAEEFENLKESSTYDLKINRIKQTYNDLVEQSKAQAEQQEIMEQESFIEQGRNELVNMLSRQEEFYNFEIPNEIKQSVLRNIFESDNNEVSRFIERHVDNPKGLLNTALAVEMLPLIVNEYKMLLDELDSLKSNKNFIETSPFQEEYVENYSDFDAESFANFLK